MIKKAIGYIGTYFFYGIGHTIYCLCMYVDKLAYALYPIYNKSMVWSAEINDWAGISVWRTAKSEGLDNE